MRPFARSTRLVFLLVLIFSFQLRAQVLTHSRSYGWEMERGNLIPNWSFENTLQGWQTAAPTGYTIDPHSKAATVAEGGSFVGRVTGSSGTTATGSHERLSTSLLPIEPGTSYTLSFHYTASGLAGSTWPVVWFYRDRATRINPATATGSAYVATASYLHYTLNMTAPDDAAYAMVVLAVSNGASQGGTFQFDNVLLEEGWYSNADVLAARARIGMSVTFGDHLGRSHQSHTKVGAGRYQAASSGFEDFARPESTFLPIAHSTSNPTYRTDLLSLARTLYNGTSGVPDAGTYPFSEVQYANEPTPRVLSQGAPGTNFRLGSTHETKQGFFFLSALTAAGLPANLESPATDAAQRDYRVDWSRTEDSVFSLTWTNRLGQVVQTARNVTRGGTSAAAWTWSFQQYEYYPDGRLKRTRTPLDVAAANLKFAEIKEHNTLGQAVATYTKNSGLTRYWYNRRGEMRFSQDSGQKDMGAFTYREYDSRGRLLSQGVQFLSSVTQAIADQDIYNGGTKQEHVGYVYDDYDQIAPRIGGGLTLDQIMPYHYFIDKRFGHGRLVCQYNRNKDGRHPGFTDLDNLVADFYGYDDRSRLTARLKAVHPVRDGDKKFQDAYFTYDEAGRLVESRNFVAAVSGTLASSHRYTYDLRGRVQKVVGLADKPLAEFAYHDWGPLKQVILGGNGTGAQGTKVEYFYHIRGWVREIKCTNLSTGKVTFQEFLGYDGKAHAATQVPDPIKRRYGGQITQKLYSLGREMNSSKPVRLQNFNYDELGRMLASDYRRNTNTDPYNTDETINFGAPLGWDLTNNELDSYVAYDLNGRITGQRSGNVPAADSAKYGYYDGTYKLDSIGGKINQVVTRNMKPRSTFVYDGRGRMTWDNSKQLEIRYGWDNLPTEFVSYLNGAPTFQHDYYDASGNRVSRFLDGSAGYTGTHYLRLGTGNSKEWRETYDGGGNVTATATVVNLYGRSRLGRIRSDGAYEFVLKDHQGTSMKTVSDLGSPGNNVYDYLAYGDLRKLKETGGAAAGVTEKYTGKEYEDLSRLYAFGARWFDPELGVWMNTDPASQYINPYFFVGGNPVNNVDPDGREAIWITGIGGVDFDNFPQYNGQNPRSSICRANPSHCGDGTRARFGNAYGSGNIYQDLAEAFLSPVAAAHYGNRILGQMEDAYAASRAKGEEFVLFAHSGGASVGYYATGAFNQRHWYGSVDRITTVAGFDFLGLGRSYASLTGTEVESYYNTNDIVSYGGALMDLASPGTFATDPGSKLDVFNMDRWCMDGHNNTDVSNCRTVNDMLKDRVWGYAGVAKYADYTSQGVDAYGYVGRKAIREVSNRPMDLEGNNCTVGACRDTGRPDTGVRGPSWSDIGDAAARVIGWFF